MKKARLAASAIVLIAAGLVAVNLLQSHTADPGNVLLMRLQHREVDTVGLRPMFAKIGERWFTVDEDGVRVRGLLSKQGWRESGGWDDLGVRTTFFGHDESHHAVVMEPIASSKVAGCTLILY